MLALVIRHVPAFGMMVVWYLGEPLSDEVVLVYLCCRGSVSLPWVLGVAVDSTTQIADSQCIH